MSGFRNQSELPGYYALADIFVLPAFCENWGLVVNEAMNAGCAIIVTDEVGASADLVRDKENGFVIPAGDFQALKTAISSTLKNNNFIEMGKNSLSKIENWGIEENVQALEIALGLKTRS